MQLKRAGPQEERRTQSQCKRMLCTHSQCEHVLCTRDTCTYVLYTQSQCKPESAEMQ